MRAAGLCAVLAVLVFAVAACDSDDDASDDSSTGVASLDAVIEAVESGDAADVRGLLEFQTQECTSELGAGGPPKCAEGEADGTAVEVFSAIGCEPEWRREDDVDAWLVDVVLARDPMRFAAFEAPDGYLWQAEGDYVALFTGPVAVGVADGRIVEIQLGCGAGEDPRNMIPDGVDLLLEPPEE